MTCHGLQYCTSFQLTHLSRFWWWKASLLLLLFPFALISGSSQQVLITQSYMLMRGLWLQKVEELKPDSSFHLLYGHILRKKVALNFERNFLTWELFCTVVFWHCGFFFFKLKLTRFVFLAFIFFPFFTSRTFHILKVELKHFEVFFFFQNLGVMTKKSKIRMLERFLVFRVLQMHELISHLETLLYCSRKVGLFFDDNFLGCTFC